MNISMMVGGLFRVNEPHYLGCLLVGLIFSLNFFCLESLLQKPSFAWSCTHFLSQFPWSCFYFHNPPLLSYHPLNSQHLLSFSFQSSSPKNKSTTLLVSLYRKKNLAMSMTISTIYSPTIWRNYPHPPSIISTRPLLTSHSKTPLQNLQFHRSPAKTFAQRFLFSGAKLGFCVKAENVAGGGEMKGSNGEEEERELEELRGKSTMPDRFKYLTKEAPSPPLRWPWFVALAFLIYAWRSVLWELSNWQKVVMGMFQFLGYLIKLALAIIFHFIGDPITHTVLYIETALNAIRDFYFSIVTSAPIPELTTILILASTVLAIGEAASPNSVNSQPYILTVAAIIGYGAVKGIVIEPFFWLLLFGIFGFSRVFKKRDNVSSALPVATVLASVGEQWIRVLAVFLFTSLAIHHHSKKLADGEEAQVKPSSVNIPLPLLGVALAIGIRVAAKWAGYRHLTWMIA